LDRQTKASPQPDSVKRDSDGHEEAPTNALSTLLLLLKEKAGNRVSLEADFILCLSDALSQLGWMKAQEIVRLIEELQDTAMSARKMQLLANAAHSSAQQLRKASKRVRDASSHLKVAIAEVENARKWFAHDDVIDVEPLEIGLIQKQLHSMKASLDVTAALYLGLIAPDLRTAHEGRILEVHPGVPRAENIGLLGKQHLHEWVVQRTQSAMKGLSCKSTDADVARIAKAIIQYALNDPVKVSAITQRLRRSRLAPRAEFTSPIP
jgi:hypothetical protein